MGREKGGEREGGESQGGREGRGGEKEKGEEGSHMHHCLAVPSSLSAPCLWLWNERKVTVTSRAGGVEGDPSIWPAEEKCLEAVDVLVV